MEHNVAPMAGHESFPELFAKFIEFRFDVLPFEVRISWPTTFTHPPIEDRTARS
jgi:hypothetical protein